MIIAATASDSSSDSSLISPSSKSAGSIEISIVSPDAATAADVASGL